LCSRRPAVAYGTRNHGERGWPLWEAVSQATIAPQPLRVLDELLVALMLVEILHTVWISIRSQVLLTEPFLVVGLIASIRRMLVISLELATLTKQGAWSTEAASLFRASMRELGLLGLLVLALVFSITLLRQYPIAAKKLGIEHPAHCSVSRFCERGIASTPIPGWQELLLAMPHQQ
jgi:hypothetical protein